MAKTIDTPRPFEWDGDYKNNEQVRPYYAAYCEARNVILSAGKYPYNDSFNGNIAGLFGPREDTAIYMLQTMHDLDAMKRRVAEFRAAGGVDVATLEAGKTYRGTVVIYAYYMGGTGWTLHENARVERTERGTVYTLKGKRNGSYATGSVMVKLGR